MKTKYNNKKTTVDNIKFDSKKESKRYGDLKMRERAGEISGLKLQVPFPIEVNGKVICRYVADFLYIEKDKLIVEDVKSEVTRRLPVYRLKKKLLAAVYGIENKEV